MTRPAFGRLLSACLLVLVGAAGWRCVIAQKMPVIARDGVHFIDLAQRLDARGAAAIRDVDFNQHPLYPLLVAAVRRILPAADWPLDALLWIRAGTAVSFACGLAVIVLAALLAKRITAAVTPNLDSREAGAWALLLAAILPMNVWLSIDVMSEQLFLALSLASILLMSRLTTAATSFAGVCAGLAFLTRPEAVTLLAAAAAAFVLDRAPLRQRAARLSFLLAAFVLVAAPYWITLGGFSPKSRKPTVEQVRTAIVHDAAAQRDTARSLIRETSWFEAPFASLYETARAGRVVVPALGFVALLALRRKLPDPALAIPLACAVAHLSLATLLVARHGYLDPRHTLLVVELLIAPAAITLTAAADRLRRMHLPWVVACMGAAALVPLAYYATRIPGAKEAHLRTSALRILIDDPGAFRRPLLGESSHSRIAFYAGMRFVRWPEDIGEGEQRYAILRDAIRGFRPRYVTIETGEGEALAGNEDLLQRFVGDAEFANRRLAFVQQADDGGGRVFVYRMLDNE